MRLLPFAALVILNGSLAAAQSAGRGDTTFTWSKQLPANTTLVVRNLNGPIDVRTSSGTRVEVRVITRVQSGRNPADLGVDVRERTGEAMFCSTFRGQSACDPNHNFDDVRASQRFIIEVPRNIRVNVTTGNGDVDIAQSGSETHAVTGNGRISIGETEGSVVATTGNGDVAIESAKGPVKVSTGNGRIFVMTTNGPVNASSGNGDIDVRMKGLSVRESMTFSTGSGSVRLTIPSSFNGEIDAGTGNGELRSDFEIRVVGRLDPQHIRGSIGSGGGPVIRLRTGNGRMELRKG